MKTVVIRMDDLSPNAAGVEVYPVQLFFDNGQGDWLTQPIATSSIPKDLSVPNPPLDPATGTPIDGNKIRDPFLMETGASDWFVKWGRYLHQLLFQGPVAQEWNRLHALYPREVLGQSEGLRTILDIKPDTLKWLPWELIFQAPMPWFFDPANPFSRGSLENNLPVKTFMWPVHALIVVGSKKDDKQVNADTEVDAIERAFIKSPVPIDWYVCYQPTKAELSDLINKYKPQIFHFIGHGREVNNYSYLELTDKTGGLTSEEWTVGDVAIDLQAWQPRLAFINACRTSSAAAQKNSWDIARTFSNAGVPAVIGMQADIQGDAAAEFSKKLYQSMLGGQSIDRSLAEARAAVKNLKTITLRRRDWALATLYLRQLPEQILAMTPPIDNKTIQKFQSDDTLKKTRDFVGRLRQRRKLWHGVDRIPDRDDEFNSAYIVVGNDQMGKTSLVQASMKVCALRNRKVSYVDIGYGSTKSFVEILKLIREGDPKSGEIICASLPAGPFAAFDNKYGALWKDPNAVTILAADNNLCEQFFTAYKDALNTIADQQPLIIVLDHLSVEWKTFNLVLVKQLLLPIAQGELPNCRLVLACTVKEFDEQIPDSLKNASRVVDVAAWKPDRYAPLMRQICLYNDISLDQEVEGLITAMSKIVKSDWGPTQLRDLLNPIKTARGVRT